MTRASDIDHTDPHAPIVFGDDSASGAFGAFRFGPDDLRELPRVVHRAALLSELLPILSALSADPLETFTDISLVPQAAGLSREARKTLLELLLRAVDRDLQALYRRHLARHPPADGARHDEKIASLALAREEAQRIAQSYGWRWLARWLRLDLVGETEHSCLARLSNFALEAQRINFRLTYHCNIACRHCYNHSGPDKKSQRLPLERMLALVAEAPAAGVTRLKITGGEPFLYPDDLTALVAAGRAAGLRCVSLYTNAFWAATEQKARATLERLAAAGFMQGPEDHIKASSGAYHEEFIAFDRVTTLARVYFDMFGRALPVDVELPAEEGEEAALLFEQRAREAAAGPHIQLYFRNVAPMGRARGFERPRAARVERRPCPAINQIVFDPDGLARPCCGLNNENAGIIVGDMKAHGLRDLVKRMQNDPILQALANEPIEEMFRRLGRTGNADGYGSLCASCQDAVGDLRDREALQAQLFERQKFYPFWFALAPSD
jgi:MoaA/NifB/PqqE/SkfB family radical SAM enzyme